MAVFEIPLTPDIPSYTQETRLDGIAYRFLFRWNDRVGRWFMTIYDIDGNVLVGSRKVTLGVFLLRYVREDGRPPGDLIMFDLSGHHEEPTLSTFGHGCALYYLTADELYDAVVPTVAAA